MGIKDIVKNVVHSSSHGKSDTAGSVQAPSDGAPAQQPNRQDEEVVPAQHKVMIELTLLPDSLVVVTGANGNIGSHIVDQLIQAGFRVRGTVRDVSRNQWLVDRMERCYGPGRLELIEVTDMAASHAFDEAVKGAVGFIHTATPVMTSPDPNAVIPAVVDGTKRFLESAAREPGMKRVVLTSSSGACTNSIPDKEFIIDSSTWNEAAVEAAYAPPPYVGLQRTGDVYFASKTKGEQAAWQWMKENKPQFVLNVVLPNANFGAVIDPENQGYHGTQGWIRDLFRSGEHEVPPETIGQPPQYYVNIADDAAIHVAALMYPDVNGERLFAFAKPYNWNDILAIFRRMFPERQFASDVAGLGRDRSKVANERAEELLLRIKGHGWTSLEDTLRQNVEGYA